MSNVTLFRMIDGQLELIDAALSKGDPAEAHRVLRNMREVVQKVIQKETAQQPQATLSEDGDATRQRT